MSATPEMKWERSKAKLSTMEILLCDNGTSIQVYGPSREAVAQKILAMEQVAGVLQNMLAVFQRISDGSTQQCADEVLALGQARAALAALEGKT